MNTQRPRTSRLQFSLRAVLLALTLLAVVGWWWQKAFQEVTLILQPQTTNRGTRHVELTKTVSKRRHGLGDILTDGPTIVRNDQGALISEEQWRQGLRQGTYQRWDDAGNLLFECEFERGRLIRLGKTNVPAFVYNPADDEPTNSIPQYDRTAPPPRELVYVDFSVNEPTRRVFQALNGYVTIDYVNQPLEEVLDDIRFNYELPMMVDKLAYRGLNLQVPITTVARDKPLPIALLDALGPLERTIAVRYEMVWVTTRNSVLHDDDLAPRISTDNASPELANTLSKPTSCDYLDQPLGEVLEDLGFTHRTTIEADIWKRSRPVNLNVRWISFRSVLGTLLYLYDLRCEAKGDKLIITSLPRKASPAKSTTITTPPLDPFSKEAPSENTFSGR